MKKILAVVFAAILLLGLAACGSSGAQEVYTGTYATMYGIRVEMSEVYSDGFNITLTEGGKCKFSIGSKSATGVWSLDGTAFTATVQKEDYTGTLENGVITLTDVQGSGVDLVFINQAVPGAEEFAQTGSVTGDELLNSITESATGTGDAETEAPAAAAAAETDFWCRDWYGWWVIRDGTGEYTEASGNWWDAAAEIKSNGDGTATITLWDEDSEETTYAARATLLFVPDGSAYGMAVASEGSMYGCDFSTVGSWMITPATSTLNGAAVDNVIAISGNYMDDSGTFTYDIYLRPWGTVWDDIVEDDLPYYYNDWYLPLLEQGVTKAPAVIGPQE